MNTEHLFAREEVLPSWWANALGYFLSLGAFQFELSKADATHIQAVAGAGDQGAAITVEGRWRWIEATVNRAHPGGAAGTYDVFVTAKETSIAAIPAPYTDNTDYSFGLAIVAAGATPPIVAGVVDLYRKVGSLQWDGAQITRIDQTVPNVSPHHATHSTGGSDPIAPADIGAATATGLAAEIARAEGVEAGLVATGSTATLSSLTLTGAGTALTVTNNATISGTLGVTGAATFSSTINANGTGTGLAVANNATVGGTLGVTGLLTATGGVSVPARSSPAYQGAQVAGNAVLSNFLLAADANPAFRINGGGVILWGPGGGTAPDTNLYRTAVASLKTDGAFTVGGAATLSGGATVTGALTSTTDLKARFGAVTEVGVGAVVGGKSGIYFQGAEAGSNLYRSAAGALTIDGILTVAGAGTGLSVTNNATVGGTLGVTGTSTVAAVNASGGYTQSGVGTNTFTGATTFSATGTALTVTNNMTVSGTATIAVAAVTTFSGTPNFTGAVTGQTAAPGDNTGKLATTAFVIANATAKAMPAPVYLQTGSFAGLAPPQTGSTASWAGTTGDWIAYPFSLAATRTVTSLSVHVNTVGAGSTVRLGIYADNGGQPGALIVDAGTVDTHTSTGDKTLTISQALLAGTLYWVVVVQQGSVTTPTLTSISGATQPFPAFSSSLASVQTAAFGYKIGGTGATGSIAGALPGNLNVGTAPAVATSTNGVVSVFAGA